MRKLSDSFIHALKDGFLAPLTQRVIEDSDLDLEIRNNAINIYYKGNSLLHLAEAGSQKYRVVVHPKFTDGMALTDLVDEATTQAFLQQIPTLKENIRRHGKSSL